MFRSFLFIVVIFVLNTPGFSQQEKRKAKKDSLYAKLLADSSRIFRKMRFRPYVNLDQRNSFIASAPINVNGLQLGVMINEKHVWGMGGYNITLQTKSRVKTKTSVNADAYRDLILKYLTIFYQYTLVDHRFIEVDLQVELGAGNYNIQLKNAASGNVFAQKGAGFLVGGTGPILAIKPFPWVGLNGMAGFRFTTDKNPNLNFSGFYYAYGVWLDIRQIHRDIRYHVIKKQKYRKELRRWE